MLLLLLLLFVCVCSLDCHVAEASARPHHARPFVRFPKLHNPRMTQGNKKTRKGSVTKYETKHTKKGAISRLVRGGSLNFVSKFWMKNKKTGRENQCGLSREFISWFRSYLVHTRNMQVSKLVAMTVAVMLIRSVGFTWQVCFIYPGRTGVAVVKVDSITDTQFVIQFDHDRKLSGVN